MHKKPSVDYYYCVQALSLGIYTQQMALYGIVCIQHTQAMQNRAAFLVVHIPVRAQHGFHDTVGSGALQALGQAAVAADPDLLGPLHGCILPAGRIQKQVHQLQHRLQPSITCSQQEGHLLPVELLQASAADNKSYIRFQPKLMPWGCRDQIPWWTQFLDACDLLGGAPFIL